MKREIRFRIWTGNQMDYQIMAGYLGAYYVAGVDSKDSASMSPFNTKYNDEFHAPMQFTGLKDKNGKEVYEGDVLNKKTTFNNNMADKRFQSATQINVEFDNGCFLDANTNRVLFESMITTSSFPQKSWTEYEIIGNIYETPELL